MQIAYIGYQAQMQYITDVGSDENLELLHFLKQKGLSIELVFWDDPNIDWKVYDLVVLKSPWNYHEAIEKFHQWLTCLQEMSIKVCNPIDLMKWNSDKHYLKEIEKAGLPVIPSFFFEKGSQIDLNLSYFKLWDTPKLVLKPCISAGAKNTLILHSENLHHHLATINHLLREADYLIQPFEETVGHGEWSFIFFNQQFSHAVLKIPKSGDFRVQHHFGGTIHSLSVKPAYLKQVEKYVHQFAKGSLYARVDGLIKNDQFYLMELELIEPYLFLQSKQDRMERYYQALKAPYLL